MKMELPDELTEKMHSEFKVSAETEIKHKAMSLWTLCGYNKNDQDVDKYCKLYGITKEDALKWYDYWKELSERK